jgi:thiol-disulfide isomerase/thioredoxin
MTRFFSRTLAVASLLVLSACNGYVSEKQQGASQSNELAPQVTQEPALAPVVQDVPTQEPPDRRPVPTKQPEPNPAQRSYRAGAIQTYDPTTYAQALADGKTVILDFHASWCATCAANAPAIRAAFESTGNTNVVGFIADYDIETVLESQFGVYAQSTLVKVRGGDPKSAKKVGSLGPGPLTQQQVEAFIQS